jgi:hypothetical protein
MIEKAFFDPISDFAKFIALSRDQIITNPITQLYALSLVASEKYSHSAYTGYTKTLQHQWTFLQRVVPDIDDLFKPLEDMISSSFYSSQLYLEHHKTLVVISEPFWLCQLNWLDLLSPTLFPLVLATTKIRK